MNQKNSNLTKEYKIKKIFITGAGGLVGSELTNVLGSLSYFIYANDINFSYRISKLENINKLKFDLLLKNTFTKFSNVEIFIHNSAITKPSKFKSNSLLNENIKLTKKALILAKKMQTKKFFYISSTSVYRNYKKLNYNERSKTSGKDPYSKSKLISENICREFCTKNKIKLTILRLGNVYCGYEKSKWSRVNVSLIQNWLNSYENNKLLKTNSFNSMRDWTYLKDIPNVIHSLIKNNNNFKILNLVSPYISSDIDIMKKITKHKNLLKTYNKEAIYNASYSIYKNKIKFNNWTSIQRGISLIKKLDEKN